MENYSKESEIIVSEEKKLLLNNQPAILESKTFDGKNLLADDWPDEKPLNHKEVFFSRQTLFILVGPSGAGKSSFAKRYFSPTITVSTDRCRELIIDSPSNQRVSEDAFELFYFLIKKRLKYKRTTIADSTALKFKYRKKLQEIAQEYQFSTVLFFFDIPQKNCLENDKKRKYIVGEEVLLRQWIYLETTRQQLIQESYDKVIVFHSLSEIDQFCYNWVKNY